MLTILQGSDLHFGKHHLPRVAVAFLVAAQEVEPDVIVLAGDFTQRAKVREYEQAREYLDALPDVPVVVTPGNHDVPLYRIHERVLAPHRNYRAHISPDLDTVTHVKGAVLVSLDSSSPHKTIVNGRLETGQVAFAARIFQECSAEDVRILVAHHPLAHPPDGGKDPPLPGNRRLLDAFRDMGVELILGGHLHRGFVVRSGSVCPEHRSRGEVLMVHSGTATSNRGRLAEQGRNSLNVLRIGADDISVTPHWFEEDHENFVACATTTIARVR